MTHHRLALLAAAMLASSAGGAPAADYTLSINTTLATSDPL